MSEGWRVAQAGEREELQHGGAAGPSSKAEQQGGAARPSSKAEQQGRAERQKVRTWQRWRWALGRQFSRATAACRSSAALGGSLHSTSSPVEKERKRQRRREKERGCVKGDRAKKGIDPGRREAGHVDRTTTPEPRAQCAPFRARPLAVAANASFSKAPRARAIWCIEQAASVSSARSMRPKKSRKGWNAPHRRTTQRRRRR